MNFYVNRINPNQTQVFFSDGRFETLTNEELNVLLQQYQITQPISIDGTVDHEWMD